MTKTDTGQKNVSYFTKLEAMLWRNFLIKKRNRRTVAECFLPLAMLSLFFVSKQFFSSESSKPLLTKEPANTPLTLTLTNSIEGAPYVIYVVPDTLETRKFSEEMLSYWAKTSAKKASRTITTQIIEFEFIDNEKQLEQLYHSNYYFERQMNLAIVFDDFANMSYTIRTNPSLNVPSPSTVFSSDSGCRDPNGTSIYPESPLSCPINAYVYSNFLTVQRIVEGTWLNLTLPKPAPEYLTHFTMQLFPKGPTTLENTNLAAVRYLLPFYMVVTLSYFILYLLNVVVKEKEKKIKEGLRLMGLSDSIYWSSWFLVYMVFITCLCLVATLTLFIVGVFENSDPALVFLLFLLYDMSIIMLSFLFTTFFDNPRVAGTFGALTVCFLNLFYYIQVATGDATPTWVYWLLCLLAPTGFALGMDKAIVLEVNFSSGVSVANLWAGPGLPLAGVYIMLAVDVVLYGFLAYYLDNVLPSEHGAKRSPFFCLKFWSTKNLNGEVNEAYDGNRDNKDVEPVHDSLKERAALKVRGLSKTFYPYRRPPVQAVRGLSLDVYEGQITAILGHNGAGKTTLFNMLTGMTRPSEGSAYFYDCDLSDPSESAGIKQMSGVCPQQDVLFEQLTTREHLEFFAMIRGMNDDIIDKEVDDIIKDVGLEDKADVHSIKLSGGQKRKLSIGIALIGDPKIVFLDEPTAGVDPYSRRKLWNTLQKRKGEKIILLTTHFMDEADLLADRKAILSQGKLRCLGSSLFLKNKFGLGYHLTFVLNDNFRDATKIQHVIHHYLPEAKLNRHHGRELSYVLPRDKLAAFSPLFSYLEGLVKRGEANDLGFVSYGVSMTSLEEVFLKIAEEAEQQKLIEEERQMNLERNLNPNTDGSQIDDWELLNELDTTNNKSRNSQALAALLKIRAKNLFQDPMAIVYQVFLPVAFAAFGIFLGTRSATTTKATKQLFTLDKYRSELSNQTFLYSDSENEMLDFWLNFAKLNGLNMSTYSGEFSEIVGLLNNSLPHAFGVDTMDFYNHSSYKKAASFQHSRLRFNDTFVHLPPIILNTISNALLTLNNVKERIYLSVSPLPGVDPVNTAQLTCALFIGIVFAFGPTNLACEMVLDREIQAKNLLRVNGLSFLLYYGPFFILLGSMMILASWLIIVLIWAFKFEALNNPTALGTLALLCITYCPAGIVFAMCASFVFKTLESAQSILPSLLSLTGTLPYLLVMVCDMFKQSADVATGLHILFCFVDVLYIPYGIVFYMIKIYFNCLGEFGQDATEKCGSLSFEDYMTLEIIAIFVAIFFQFGFYSILLYILDVKSAGGKLRDIFCSSKSAETRREQDDIESEIFPGQGDSDVIQEYLRVRRLMNTPKTARDVQTAVMIQDLHKKYRPSRTLCYKKRRGASSKPKSALETLSFAVQPGEVFGLLGHNGAGKTTTMKIITAEEAPTYGRVEVAGHDVSLDRSMAFQKLGYCPQHDALWQNISIKGHLKVYAAIRGIDPSYIDRVVRLFLRELKMEEHASKYVKECSGGTKRKLSYAIAMLGNPAIVLMDEPSTGMDPQSKRFLWNTISASIRGKRGAVLTTHSMEEADALCSRIGIMVSGELRCLGTGQHLKNRYGSDYLLEIKMKPQTTNAVERVDSLMRFLRDTFSNATFHESFEDRISFSVPQEGMKSLAMTFNALEAARETLDIEEYSFSQTTLEQVFLRFASEQERGKEET